MPVMFNTHVRSEREFRGAITTIMERNPTSLIEIGDTVMKTIYSFDFSSY